MENLGLNVGFWADKRVLITGHTGFKGSWLSEVLNTLGARVSGLSLPPQTSPSLFNLIQLSDRMEHILGDICDYENVKDAVLQVRPEVVFHLAAQSLVRRSYSEPLMTWNANVLGTAHVLEAVRSVDADCVIIVATTDKVYQNNEWEHAYRELDRLGGSDAYSASKVGAELVVECWRKSFLANTGIRLASVRSGNVIGGGDWSDDRIIPDLVRAFGSGKTLEVRNGSSVRPWQHVLDPLWGYLLLAESLAGGRGVDFETSFNFGPEAADLRTVSDLVEAAHRHWAGNWLSNDDKTGPHEASRLSLAIERARQNLGWSPRWDFEKTVEATVTWYRDVSLGSDPAELTRKQIIDFGFWK